MIRSRITRVFNFLGVAKAKNVVVSNIELDEKRLYFKQVLNLEIDCDTYCFCYDGFEFIKSLKEHAHANFAIEQNELIISVKNIRVKPNSWEELLILNEVFIKGVYNFSGDQQFMFIDVGMNVGITSLYFSNDPLCKKVVSFEPFKKTIDLALKNFSLNDSSNKIRIHNVGLGYPARVLEVNYSEEYKGSVGLNGVASYILKEYLKERTELKIVDVYEAIKDELILGMYTVMKIDCEGAEYEIIKRLEETDIIGSINFYMIEWHLKGPSTLKEIFVRNNFTLLSLNEQDNNIGMLYAFKNN